MRGAAFHAERFLKKRSATNEKSSPRLLMQQRYYKLKITRKKCAVFLAIGRSKNDFKAKCEKNACHTKGGRRVAEKDFRPAAHRKGDKSGRPVGKRKPRRLFSRLTCPYGKASGTRISGKGCLRFDTPCIKLDTPSPANTGVGRGHCRPNRPYANRPALPHGA